MTELDTREKAFENKFAHDEELKFKITSRAKKLLGLWAAEELGLSEKESLTYAMNIVQLGVGKNPLNIIQKDFTDNGKSFTESHIRIKFEEFEEIARRQFSK